MSNLKYFLAGVLIMAITSCMQKDSELFLFVGSYADATDPGIIIRKTKNSSFKNEKSKKEVDVTITVSNKDIV